MKELNLLLKEMYYLLNSVKEEYWSRKIQDYLEENKDNLSEVSSWYGGMGSLNDLIISPLNNHYIGTEKESILNEKLDDLRDRVYQYIKKLE